jgi:uncharacterized membrane protein|tara:strand:- start:1651 stop:1836 length:186 start_codon:yes stop_codon:yes gene_type:complete
MKDRVMLVMVFGLIGLLAVLVVGDFYIALRENRSPDASIVELLKMSITGFIGVIAGYMSKD